MTVPENHYAARKLTHDNRTFLVVSSSTVFDESTGEVFPRAELADRLCRWTGARDESAPILATNNAPALLKELDDKLSNFPNWTWRATPLRRVKRSAVRPSDSRPAVSVHLHPHYCGFKRVNGKQRNRYFHFADCSAITGSTSDAIYPDLCHEESLRNWAFQYRELCRDNGLSVCSARGRFGSAMLRDPRFIGSSKRRIPAFVNEIARGHLPGNHYQLRTEPGVIKDGLYLDITNAHHDAASRTQFPSSEGLRARGKTDGFDWENLQEGIHDREPWAPINSRKYSSLRRTHGLVLLRVGSQGISKGSIVHPAVPGINSESSNLIAAYTNEIPLLESCGVTIYGIESAITSGRTDDSLNRYARHATETLSRASKEDKPWIKSLFLSTYGMLGKRPTAYQSVSNMGGKPITWPTSAGWIAGGFRQTQKEHSPAPTNVIALGMIQAETRRNVIELARDLQDLDIDVLALYADSLIVSATQLRKNQSVPTQLPFLPPEWRLKTELTQLRFLDRVSWVSNEEERLPGRTRESVLRESRRRAIQARAYERTGIHAEETRPIKAQDWLLAQAESGI